MLEPRGRQRNAGGIKNKYMSKKYKEALRDILRDGVPLFSFEHELHELNEL